MPSYNALIGIVLGVAGIALMGFMAGLTLARYRATQAENTRLNEGYSLLQKQLAESQARAEELRQSLICNSHTSAARASADAIEASLFDLIAIRDEAQTLIERINFAANRAEHVRNGGSPDDMRRPRKK